MGVEFRKPYSISEISKHPFAVVISLLIGLLLISLCAIGFFAKKWVKEVESNDAEKVERIKMYENMIFYKQKAERLETEQQQSDSLIREKTQPFVEQIFKK